MAGPLGEWMRPEYEEDDGDESTDEDSDDGDAEGRFSGREDPFRYDQGNHAPKEGGACTKGESRPFPLQPSIQ
jgi:hypothetical protein